MTDSWGSVISRWTGYTGGAKRFIGTLTRKLKDLTTVQERLGRFSQQPTLIDAVVLARYHADARDNIEAAEFYRQAGELSPHGRYKYTHEIFTNLANAAWSDKITYDEVLPSADAVLTTEPPNANHVVKVATLMTRLARKFDRTDEIAKYLQAGLDITAGSEVEKLVAARHLFMADYTLYITNDTTRTLRIKKASLGQGWQNDRDKFVEFAKWCLERKINLEEAELFARKAIDLVFPGKYRAKIYNTISEICSAQGNNTTAIAAMQAAVNEEPESEYYQKQLAVLQNSGVSGPE